VRHLRDERRLPVRRRLVRQGRGPARLRVRLQLRLVVPRRVPVRPRDRLHRQRGRLGVHAAEPDLRLHARRRRHAAADRKFKRPFRAAPPAPPPPGHGRVTRRAAPAGAACSPAARGGTRSGQVPLLGRGF
jgi:hypothetical protein